MNGEVAMRVADYVWQFFVERGGDHVFLVTGGNAMHLNDALSGCSDLNVVCMHHEQAIAMAAEGYARVEGKPGIISTSSGPAAINALSGMYGAYVDSQPVICVAGQSKRELLRPALNTSEITGLRQLGIQEADAVSMARPVTKYAVTVLEPFQIRYELEKAWYFATVGRPGPVFVEIPLDVQATMVEPEKLPVFQPQISKSRSVERSCQNVLKLLRDSSRPVLVGGEGIREGNAVESFKLLAELLKIPVVTAWMPDIYPPDRPFYAGRLGTLGTRAGNFAVQNADLLLVVGSRLSIPQVGFNWEAFAREGCVISVNLEATELNKPIDVVDLAIVAEPKEFMDAIRNTLERSPMVPVSWSQWLDWCKVRVKKYPEAPAKKVVPDGNGIHPYHFIQQLFDKLEDDAFVACGNAMSACVAFQSAPLRKHQRLTSNASAGAMGHDLPSAIGSACARLGRRVICLAGDGSLMMNIQELQTVAHLQLPVGIVVLNNDGYHSIRTTQNNFFGRTIGESEVSGVSFPDYVEVAKSFGITAYRIVQNDFPEKLDEILANQGPWLCDVHIDDQVGLEPRASSKMLDGGQMVTAPIEEMYPFLKNEEFLSNMLISAQDYD